MHIHPQPEINTVSLHLSEIHASDERFLTALRHGVPQRASSSIATPWEQLPTAFVRDTENRGGFLMNRLTVKASKGMLFRAGYLTAAGVAMIGWSIGLGWAAISMMELLSF